MSEDKNNSTFTFQGSVIGMYLNDLLGETLTLIDATFSDPIQKKALKDIIKKSFYACAYNIKRDEGIKLIGERNNLSDILIMGSRPVDPELDLNEEGKFK